MYVNINKTGKNKATVHIKNGTRILWSTVGNFCNDTVGDEYVGSDEIALNKHSCIGQDYVQIDLSFRSQTRFQTYFSLNLQYYITMVTCCQDIVAKERKEGEGYNIYRESEGADRLDVMVEKDDGCKKIG